MYTDINEANAEIDRLRDELGRLRDAAAQARLLPPGSTDDIDWAEERKKPQRIQIIMDDGRPLIPKSDDGEGGKYGTLRAEDLQASTYPPDGALDTTPEEHRDTWRAESDAALDGKLDDFYENTPEEREQLRQLTEAGIDITEVSTARSEVIRDDMRRCWTWDFGPHVRITSFDIGKQLIELEVQTLGGGRVRYTYYRQGMEGKWSNMGNGSMVGPDAVARRSVDALGYPIPHELEMWVQGERP